MDTTVMSQLLLSIAIFAPGLILLAGLGLIGLVMILERTVLRGQLQAAGVSTAELSAPAAANPAAGPVVAGVKEALVSAEAPAAQEKRRAVG